MIEIKEVTNKRMLKQFIEFPVKMYKKEPNYTPYLYSEEYKVLAPGKNEAESYCIFKRFLAYKDGKIAGRVFATINKYANERYNYKRVRFNRLDMIDDIEVTKALLKAVEEFGQSYGMTEINGPMGYSDEDREGLLTYGFDQMNMFSTFYNWPYYMEHLKALGYQEENHWIEKKILVPEKVDDRLLKLAKLVERRYKLHLVKFVKKGAKYIEPYVEKALKLVNICYKDLYGFVQIDEGNMKMLAEEYVPLIDTDFLQLVETEEGELVGLGLMIHTPVKGLKKHNGHLFPLGWIDFLHEVKHSKVLDMLLVAVHPDYQTKGVISMIMVDALQNCIKQGIDHAETGPEMETNTKVQALWKDFDAPTHKRRTAYIKAIELDNNR